MASMEFRKKYAKQIANRQQNGTELGHDLSSHFYNVDMIGDAIVNEELARGIEPSLELAVYDCYSGEKYRRFQKRTEEEEERYLISKGQMPAPDAPMDISEHGDKEWGNAHKEEGIYLCEWCSKLGYKRKYNSEICDSCHLCAECSQYEHYECSGCSYSRYRTGTPYCERLKASDVLSNNDQIIFAEIENDQIEGGRPIFMDYNDEYSVKRLSVNR